MAAGSFGYTTKEKNMYVFLKSVGDPIHVCHMYPSTPASAHGMQWVRYLILKARKHGTN